MCVSSVVNRDIGARVGYISSLWGILLNFAFQIAQMGTVPSPSPSPSHIPPVQELANAEIMTARPKQSEVEELKEAERKSLLMQLRMTTNGRVFCITVTLVNVLM